MLKRFRVDPRDVDAAEFPAAGTTRERLLFLLRYAILAPSIHNTQPWKFSIDGNRIGVFADRSRWLATADPDGRDLRLSLGCVLENLLVAARHFGYDPEVTYLPRPASPTYIACVDLSRFEPRVRRRDVLLDDLKRRHTTYRASEPRSVTPSQLEDLGKACEGSGAVLCVTGDPRVRAAASDLFRKACALQFADEGFRAEVAEWMGRGEYGVPGIVSHLGRLGLPQLERAMDKEAERIAQAPYFGAILSVKDDARAQVRAGQAFERVWLAAAHWNTALRPASALCELPAVRSGLARLLEAGELHVQQPFRLGHCEAPKRRSPRRRIDDVIAAISLT